MVYVGLPLFRGSTPEERNESRKIRWQKSNKLTRFLLIFVWIDKLIICGLLTFVCFASGAIILSPVPVILGLKFFAEIPTGVDTK